MCKAVFDGIFLACCCSKGEGEWRTEEIWRRVKEKRIGIRDVEINGRKEKEIWRGIKETGGRVKKKERKVRRIRKRIKR